MAVRLFTARFPRSAVLGLVSLLVLYGVLALLAQVTHVDVELCRVFSGIVSRGGIGNVSRSTGSLPGPAILPYNEKNAGDQLVVAERAERPIPAGARRAKAALVKHPFMENRNYKESVSLISWIILKIIITCKHGHYYVCVYLDSGLIISLNKFHYFV